jgi:hypothetical protein
MSSVQSRQRSIRKLIVLVTLAVVLLGACGGGGTKKANKASSSTTGANAQPNCDFARNFTTNRIGSSLTDAQVKTIASEAPADIRDDVALLLGGALKAQQVGASSKSPQELASIFSQQYKDAQQRVSTYVSKHCSASVTTIAPPLG